MKMTVMLMMMMVVIRIRLLASVMATLIKASSVEWDPLGRFCRPAPSPLVLAGVALPLDRPARPRSS